MILRIIDSQTGIFLRDDFSCNAETETAIDVEPAQGFYLPKWDGAKWIEGEPPEEIIPPEPPSPTLEERIERLEEIVQP